MDFSGLSQSLDLPHASGVLLRILVSAILGGAIGYEREIHGHPAGVRTHMLMITGVVVFSEVSRFWGDGGRIAAQIVTGVGFLGAGTILRLGHEVRGLTTAASLWATAAIGMAISAGGPFLVVAVFGTALALFVLAIVSRIEHRLGKGLHGSRLKVDLAAQAVIAPLLEAMKSAACRVTTISIGESETGVEAVLHIEGERKGALAAATTVQGVRSAIWLE